MLPRGLLSRLLPVWLSRCWPAELQEDERTRRGKRVFNFRPQAGLVADARRKAESGRRGRGRANISPLVEEERNEEGRLDFSERDQREERSRRGEGPLAQQVVRGRERTLRLSARRDRRVRTCVRVPAVNQVCAALDSATSTCCAPRVVAARSPSFVFAPVFLSACGRARLGVKRRVTVAFGDCSFSTHSRRLL